MQVVTNTEFKEFPLLSKGKVRDIYAVDDQTLLIVTTDRMSAFDVVLPDPIPYKGIVLNKLTIFWMEKFADLVDNHLLAVHPLDYPKALHPYQDILNGRSVLVKRARPLPIECIVRGYLSGSGWKDYQKTGKLCGIALPQGLQESSPLPNPIFTPSTKAEIGEHDQNISLQEAQEKIGAEIFRKVQEYSLTIYQEGVKLALDKGLIIADTKFEFGLLGEEPILIDEVLTPDSSRFWPKEEYQAGKGQPSFDKQFLRDWLQANWDKQPPAPKLPQEIIDQTQERYFAAYRLITGQEVLTS